jgi:sugar diacid utilization regulator
MAEPKTPLTPPTAPIDDVFDFCNHIAWQAGGPVLMYDSAWGVIAYSTLNQGLDEVRRSIILRREIPTDAHVEAVRRSSEERFDAGTSCFEIPEIPGVQTRRVAAPIRLLGVHVGSLWIAESAGALHPEVLDIADHAAKEASLYFQLRDDQRRREADRFARMLLEGTQDEALLAQYLGIPPTTPFRVVAVWHGGIPDLRSQTHEVSRVLAERQPARSISIECDECVCIAFYSPDSPADVNESARAFSYDMVAADERLLVGAGRLTTRLAHTPKSKADADKVIAYLRRTPGERAGSVNTLRPQIALMRLVEILDSQFEPLPDALLPLTMLEPDDREEALRTLDAYFSHPGNASEAARYLHIHPNTFRYRMAKVADLLGVDLEDRDSRLIVELELLRHRYGA